ncbi:metal-dependent hydrolase [Bacillus licheniformis]|nr:metal-dependent hydrolase [Bacillus licheniformis]
MAYHGHSVVTVDTGDHQLIFDPFITGNSLTDLKPEDVKADVILLTHGHNDHVGDTIEIAKRNNSLVVAPNELAVYLGWKGLNVHPMHIGGSHQFDLESQADAGFPRIGLYGRRQPKDRLYRHAGGDPSDCGRKDDFHAGDTGLFSDMKLIGELNHIDLAFLPIGDNLRWALRTPNWPQNGSERNRLSRFTTRRSPSSNRIRMHLRTAFLEASESA